MGTLGDIGRKFLPWKITAAERLKNHYDNGTMPTGSEVREFFKARRKRIIVGAGVGASAAAATVAGVAGFAKDGVEGALHGHLRTGISEAYDGDLKGVAEAALEAGKTIRNAGEHAIENPSEIPLAVADEIGDKAKEYIRNTTITLGLIETGTQSALGWRRARHQAGREECFGSKSPEVIATAPPLSEAEPALNNKASEGLSQNIPSKELPPYKPAKEMPQASINASTPARPPATPVSTTQSIRTPTPTR